MVPIDEIEIIEQSGGDHLLGAAGRQFFRMLENAVDLASQFIDMFGQKLGGNHQNRSVAVMSARMHLAVHHRLEIKFVPLLLDGQGIDVGAQADFLAGLAPGYFHQHGSRGRAGHLDILQLRHFVIDELARLILLKRQFRMLMQMTAVGDDLLLAGGKLLKPFFFQ